jgi:catechol 2,3-dioxygenase-like lactoylglutathione lyase family enzyme
MITAIDHIVLTSADVDKTIAFYCDVLGMELQTFNPADGSAPRRALCFGRQKINIHEGSAPYVPHARNPVSGAVDICLLSDHPVAGWQRRCDGTSLVGLCARSGWQPDRDFKSARHCGKRLNGA